MHDQSDGRALARAQLFWDASLRVGTRAYLDCPQTVMLREVRKIEFVDGGCLTLPMDTSVFHDESLPRPSALISNSSR
jgi:hypothetical protein